MILIDAHVHIYNCFDLEIFFDSAFCNFRNASFSLTGSDQPFTCLLLLAEGSKYNWFHDTVTSIADGQQIVTANGKWIIFPTGDGLSLTVQRNDSSKNEITVVAGRQIVTLEKLETLALYTTSNFADGMSLAETLTAIRESGAIPAIPWGAGKWLGRRGVVVGQLIAERDGEKKTMYLGDNGGRPKFWSTPALFQLARGKKIQILPGSDPLPLRNEAQRPGSFGFYIEDESKNVSSPALFTRDILADGTRFLNPYGSPMNNGRFLLSQLQLRLMKLN